MKCPFFFKRIIQVIIVVSLLTFVSQLALAAELAAELVSKAQTNGAVRVIIGLDVPVASPAVAFSPGTAGNDYRAALAQMQNDVLESLQSAARPNSSQSTSVDDRFLVGVKKFQYVSGLALAADFATLQKLAADPRVVSIVEDVASSPSLNNSVPLIGAENAWTLDSGFTGNGWKIAILDSGVDKDHGFFSGRVVSEACYSTNSPTLEVPLDSHSVCPGGIEETTADDSGVDCSVNNPTLDTYGVCDHGTHVAGIAAGNTGVAKYAEIISIQVFSRRDWAISCGDDPAPCIKSFRSDQIMGLERVLELSQNQSNKIAAVNLSLGGGEFSSTCDDENSMYTDIINALKAKGIPTVIASGNDNFSDAVHFPACISTAISVGASNSADDDVLMLANGGSNGASFLNLLAPGEEINSSVPPVIQNPQCPTSDFCNKHGTSMAAPHVAGAWALMRQANPDATVDEILSLFQFTGRPITDSRNGLTFPRIQVDAAISSIIGLLAEYKFDESTPQDTSGNQHHGTEHGNVQYTADGISDFAGVFNGTDSYIDTEVVAVNEDEFSISLWTRLQNYPDLTHPRVRSLVGVGGGNSGDRDLKLGIAPDGKVWYMVRTASGTLSATSPNSIELNKWVHLIGTWKRGELIKLFIDGQLVDSKPAFDETNNYLNSFFIGAQHGGPGSESENFIEAEIDEVRLYRKVICGNPAFRNDFDCDRESDLLAVNDAGTIISALVKNSVFQTFAILATADTAQGWTVNSTGDFNGDKKADVLLYNTTTGEYRILTVDGTTVLTDTVVMVLDPVIGVEPRGMADFDGDGESEIILYLPTNGVTGLAYFNGGVFDHIDVPTVVDEANNWTLKDYADFTGNNKTDLLIQNTVTGETSVIEMDGSTPLATTPIFTLNPAFGLSLRDTADFTGDGKTDILTLHTSGALAVIEMDGLTFQSLYVPGGLAPNWELVNAGRYDLDDKTDFLFFDPTTGEMITGIQDGATITSFNTVLNLGPASGWNFHKGKP